MKLDAQAIEAAAKAICRVQLNGGDPDQPAVRWNGTQMEPQDFPAWHGYRDEAVAVIEALAPLSRGPAPEPVAAPDVAELVKALKPLVDAADGLSKGYDWNSGTHAALHGYRQKLLDALPAARAALAKYRENGNG